MKKFKIAATLMFIQAVFMEIATGIIVMPLLLKNASSVSQYFSFIVPYFNENMVFMLVMSLIFGLTRLIGAIGLWNNRMWGLVLSIINCSVTMILMIFMLPAGIADGIFSCTALILMLIQYFGKQKIITE